MKANVVKKGAVIAATAALLITAGCSSSHTQTQPASPTTTKAQNACKGVNGCKGHNSCKSSVTK